MTRHSLLTPSRLCIIDGQPCLWTGSGWMALTDLRDRLDRLAQNLAELRRRQKTAHAALAAIDFDHIRTLLREAQNMTPTQMHDPLVSFVYRLDRLGDADLHDAFVTEVNELGGTWIVPEGTTTHLVEITVHGITARGASEAEAIAEWRKAAESTLTKEN